MRILIYEPLTGGHRLHYVRHIVQAMRELPVEIVVALADDAPETAEFGMQLADLGGRVAFDTSLDVRRPTLSKILAREAALLAGTIRRHRADRVYVPGADGMAVFLGLRRVLGLRPLARGAAVEGLALRGAFYYPQPTRAAALQARLTWAATRSVPWDVLHLLDPLVYEHVVRHNPRCARHCRLMPDPVERVTRDDRRAARRSLDLPEDGRYVTCVGLIDQRKGCDLLLRAFAAAGLGESDRLLLAGRHAAVLQAMLKQEPYARLVAAGRVIPIDRTITPEELTAAVEASDLVATLYPAHIGSASIAIRAAVAGRPVLASDYGWLGTIVPRFGIGRTTDVRDAERLPAVLAAALDAAADYRAGPLTRAYVAFNSLPNFHAHWTAELRRVLGMPQSPDLMPWPPAAGH